MKLEPVYLVAPRRRIPARRAFLIAAGSALAGLGVGFVGGWGARGLRTEGAPPAPGNLQTGIDAGLRSRIAWAKSVASATDDGTLRQNLAGYLAILREAATAAIDDAALWSGVDRATALVTGAAPTPVRKVHARTLLAILAVRPGPPTDSELLAALREAAGR